MSGLGATRLSPALGAEVNDLDLGAIVDDGEHDVVESIYHALIEHQVLFFSRQALQPAQHVELGRRLGHLASSHHSYNTLPGHPDVVELDWHPGASPDSAEWHSDLSFRTQPPFASILKGVVIPPIGGDTLWASMYSVHDSLDPGFRSDLEHLVAVHDPGQFRSGAFRDGGNEAMNDMMMRAGSAAWPVISHHPVTGRPYINVSESFTRWIIDVSAAESQRVLSYLFDAINRPDHHVRLRWQVGTVAIWDNRATQHYAVADYPEYRRVMHRVVVDSDSRLESSLASAAADAPVAPL